GQGQGGAGGASNTTGSVSSSGPGTGPTTTTTTTTTTTSSSTATTTVVVSSVSTGPQGCGTLLDLLGGLGPACDQCLEARCCDELRACDEGTDCFVCVSGGACSPEAEQVLERLQGCYLNECVEVCEGANCNPGDFQCSSGECIPGSWY